jgi:RecG-like helicase
MQLQRRRNVINVTIFNNKYLANSLKLYEDYILFGKLEKRLTSAEMSAPQIEKAADNAGIHRFTPQRTGLIQRRLQRWQKPIRVAARI